MASTDSKVVIDALREILNNFKVEIDRERIGANAELSTKIDSLSMKIDLLLQEKNKKKEVKTKDSAPAEATADNGANAKKGKAVATPEDKFPNNKMLWYKHMYASSAEFREKYHALADAGKIAEFSGMPAVTDKKDEAAKLKEMANLTYRYFADDKKTIGEQIGAEYKVEKSKREAQQPVAQQLAADNGANSPTDKK